jgi:hypothetical protein
MSVKLKAQYRATAKVPKSVDQDWFEMKKIRKRNLNDAVWIPLRAAQTDRQGQPGLLGYLEEFFGAGSVAIPIANRADGEALRWEDIGLMRNHRGFVDNNGSYLPADSYEPHDTRLNAVNVALAQDGNSEEPEEWHLHQDLAITLRLKREGDIWLAMNEDYCEVARLRRGNCIPILLEIRAEYLKDYLCARGMALYVSSYRLREEIVNDGTHIDWSEEHVSEGSEQNRWEGRKADIHEGGERFGSKVAALHLGMKDVDYQEDVPRLEESDENFVSTYTEGTFRGAKLIRIQGELWRNEWVEPADRSIRVRRDTPPTSISFVVDACGSRLADRELARTNGWLWFKADVITALIDRRGGSLKWYTRDTGGVRASPSCSYLHFGVNGLGLINVFAEDISNLPQWIQRIWSGLNISPEGGVCKELLAAQAEGMPAGTRAPESALTGFLELLIATSRGKFGFELFRKHDQWKNLIAHIHRFRSTDETNFFALAKDVSRLTADSIDLSELKKIAIPPKGERWGSLKSLEKVLARHSNPALAIAQELIHIWGEMV